MWFIDNKTDIHDFIIVDNIFTDKELNKVIDYCENTEKMQGGFIGEIDSDKGKQIRRSNIAWVTPSNGFEFVYRKISDIINEVNSKFFKYSLVGLNNLQYTTYNAQDRGKYHWHVDDSLVPVSICQKRKLSFSILCSNTSEFDGGEFLINTGGLEQDFKSANLQKNCMIVFPSPYLHTVTEITRGTRRSLVGWVEGPNWV